MTRAQSRAYRFRHLLLLAGLFFCVAAIFWAILPVFPNLNDALLGDEWFGVGILGTPLQVVEADHEWVVGVNGLLVVGLLLLAQWAFLRPGRHLAVRLTQTCRPQQLAVMTAATMAG